MEEKRGEISSQNYESSGMKYYFTASGCMSERIRHRYEKTSPTHILIKPMDIDDP